MDIVNSKQARHPQATIRYSVGRLVEKRVKVSLCVGILGIGACGVI